MRVVLTNILSMPFYHYGGGERYSFFLAKYLAKEGIDVYLYASGKRRESIIIDRVKIETIPPYVPYGYLKSALLRPLYFFRITNKLKSINVNIIHSFALTSYLYQRLYNIRDKKVVAQPFGLYRELNPHNVIEKIYLNYIWLKPMKFWLYNADIVAAEGPHQREEISIIFGIPREKIAILPDGVELENIKDCIHKYNIDRNKLKLDKADIILVNVNRLDRHKGVNYLIDALGILNKKLDVRLILIGAGREENNIITMIKNYGLNSKVLHFKNINDCLKYNLINLADIAVIPTLGEGLPIALLEAMACGKPIIATDVGENRQVVKNGINGFLVPPRNAEAIAESILKIYDSNSFKVLGNNSLNIVKNYDWPIIAKKAIKIYENLLK